MDLDKFSQLYARELAALVQGLQMAENANNAIGGYFEDLVATGVKDPSELPFFARLPFSGSDADDIEWNVDDLRDKISEAFDVSRRLDIAVEEWMNTQRTFDSKVDEAIEDYKGDRRFYEGRSDDRRGMQEMDEYIANRE